MQERFGVPHFMLGSRRELLLRGFVCRLFVLELLLRTLLALLVRLLVCFDPCDSTAGKSSKHTVGAFRCCAANQPPRANVADQVARPLLDWPADIFSGL